MATVKRSLVESVLPPQFEENNILPSNISKGFKKELESLFKEKITENETTQKASPKASSPKQIKKPNVNKVESAGAVKDKNIRPSNIPDGFKEKLESLFGSKTPIIGSEKPIKLASLSSPEQIKEPNVIKDKSAGVVEKKNIRPSNISDDFKQKLEKIFRKETTEEKTTKKASPKASSPKPIEKRTPPENSKITHTSTQLSSKTNDLNTKVFLIASISILLFAVAIGKLFI